MAEETKEIKGFGNWVRENSRGIVIAGVFGLGGLFVGYAIKNNAQQNRAYRQDIIGVLEKVVQQDPNQAKVLVEAIKPKEPVKEEARDIKKAIEKEAEEIAKHEDKYIRVLEERVRLREEKDALTSERNSLKQEYDKLNKAQAPLKDDLLKASTELLAAKDAKTALETKQKDLLKQIADINDVNVKLAAGKSKLNEEYVAESLAKKKLAADLIVVEKRLADVNDLYMKSVKEVQKKNEGITETTAELNKTLRDYNALLRQRGGYMPRETQRIIGESRLEEELGIDLPSHQIQTIKNTKGLSIIFLKGDLSEIDKKESDFYEKTNSLSVKDIVNRYNREPERYALLVDANSDEIEDVLYKKRVGVIRLKEGKRDGTFAPAKEVSSEFSKEVQKKYILKGFGFD